jgi:hypothetical protein
LVARPAHRPDRHNSGNHGSVLNQLEAVVCSWDLLSRQVPRLGPLVCRATPNRSWFIVLCDTNSLRADLGESLRSTSFSNRRVPRSSLHCIVGHHSDQATQPRGTTKESLVSFIDASGTNKPSPPNPAISGSD